MDKYFVIFFFSWASLIALFRLNGLIGAPIPSADNLEDVIVDLVI